MTLTFSRPARALARVLALAAATAAAACARAPRVATTTSTTTSAATTSAATTPAPALRDVFRDAFLVGVALNPDQFSERDARAAALVKAQFNSASPENVLKWEIVQPRPGPNGYDFAAADRYVAFAERNGLFPIGHTLVWHNQTPRWVFEDAAGRPASRDTVLARMREHILAVVGRYRGRIKGWDVVNEALAEDGSLRPSPWLRTVGEDYLVKAYEYAHEADPGAELYYNDFALENAPKRAGAVALIRRLQAAGVPLKAIGTQEHNKLAWPTVAQVDSTITAFAATGVRVNVTELDVDVLPPATRSVGAEVSMRAEARAALDPYKGGLPDSVQQALARRYAELFGVYLRHRDVIDRVTFWNVTDADSWLNDWPVTGRTAYPLLFDRQARPKPAFAAVVRVAREGGAAR